VRGLITACVLIAMRIMRSIVRVTGTIAPACMRLRDSSQVIV